MVFSSPSRYLAAAALVGLATAGRLMLDPALGGLFPFATYYVAVLCTAWICGFGPAVLAFALGAFLADFLFIAPRNAFRIAGRADALGFLLFCLAGVTAVLLAKDLRVGRVRLDRSNRERDLAETRRAEQGERLRVAWAGVLDGVIVTGPDGRVVSLNPVAERLLGWTSAEAEGRRLGEVYRLIDEATGAEALSPAPDALREGESASPPRGARLVARDGTTRPVDDNVTPIQDGGGEVAGLVIVFRDSTGRRRAERQLRDGEERLRLAQEAASMGHWEYDIPDRRVTWSPGLEAMHGLPTGSFAGTFEAFLADILPEDRERVIATISRSVEEGAAHHIEYRFRHPDGSIRWVEGRGRLSRDEAGRPARLIGVCMEVTDRKRAEEAARDAGRRKDVFLATLAHELRNPLAPIRTGLQILGHTHQDDPEVEPLLAMMTRQSEHLGRLVEDLMDVARISRGAIVLRKEVVSLASVVDQAVATVRHLIEDRNHELTVSVPDRDERIEADPTRLEQILFNLLSNAAKYTDPGGRIGLEARRDGDEVVIVVEDNGIGIAPEMLSEVFDLFVQVERRLDRSQGGLGIGLSLVAKLTEMHGGTITARSEGRDRGSKFLVRLPAPVEPPGAGSGPAAKPETVPGPPRRRVLVVDDNQDAANCLARYLTRVMGQQVEVAYDGAEAVEAAGKFRPEVVLLDIGLPGMSGYEVAERLRGREETGRALLIALTGWGQEDDRRRSKAVGIDFHLVKPVDLDAIRDLLIEPQSCDEARFA